MADEHIQQINVQLDPPPRVELKRLGAIVTYEVLDADLDRLKEVTDKENHSLGFMTFSFGALLSLVGSWLPSAQTIGPVTTAIFFASALSLLLSTVWFTILWRGARKIRPLVIRKIRAGRTGGDDPSVSGKK